MVFKTSVSYTNWDEGQPNRRDPYGKTGEEKCVIMWSTGKWHDYRCEVIAFFVCEKPVHTRSDIIGSFIDYIFIIKSNF